MMTNRHSLAPVLESPAARSAVAPAGDSAHLIFAIDSYPYACPVNGIERLMRFTDTRVDPSPAGAPAWEVGRIKIEDRRLRVVSLRRLWGLPPLDTGFAGYQRQALVVAGSGDDSSAMLVDSCMCVLSRLPATTARFHLPPALKGFHGVALESVAPWNGALLVVLDLDRLLEEQFPDHAGRRLKTGENP